MKLLVDMNLSPDWVAVLQKNGWETVHWSKVGDSRAADSTIMEWALANHWVIMTHDLDFGSACSLYVRDIPFSFPYPNLPVM